MPHIADMDDDFLISETPAGGLFDPQVMERLMAETQRGLWVWDDWAIALMYRDWPMKIAAPIATLLVSASACSRAPALCKIVYLFAALYLLLIAQRCILFF